MHPSEHGSPLHPEHAGLASAHTAHTEAHHITPDTTATAAKPVTVGDIVHYVLGTDSRNHGIHRPALVVHAWGNTPTSAVQLQVFTDSTNDFSHDHPGGSGMMWRTSVPHDEHGAPGTWHYPEKD